MVRALAGWRTLSDGFSMQDRVSKAAEKAFEYEPFGTVGGPFPMPLLWIQEILCIQTEA